MIDYYAILGIPRDASSLQIRDAYLNLARTTHPDKVKDPEARKKAEDAFKFVTAAYDTLSRERSRRDYTTRLPAETESKAAPARRAAPPMVQGPSLKPRESRPAPPAEPMVTPAAASSPAIPTTGRVKFDALGQGIEAFKKQDYHTAVQLLNMAVTEDETSATAHGLLAMALAKNPNWIRDAVNHMETASKLEPKNVSYLAEFALLLHSQGLKLRARRVLESAIAINPDHPDVVRAQKEIPLGPLESEASTRATGETARGLFDRLRKR
ncbi:MAG: DnaJ domain-containing protein [Vicinamibacteria bacterium]|nr:DnaJ domain-containing protein [Vicinamibacteria bacterium]